MTFLQQKGPTFILRKICQKIQVKVSQLLNSTGATQFQNNLEKLNQQKNYYDSIKKYIPKSVKEQGIYEGEKDIIQALKNDLFRIINSQLPEVVNYESKVNDKLQDLEQQIEECKKQMKSQKQNYQASILQRDKLKLQILQFEHQIRDISEETQAIKQKYEQAMSLVSKYMKENQKLQAQLLSQNKNKKIQQQENQLQQYVVSSPQNYPNSPKSFISPQINLPLQIKEKLNEAEKLLSRSPRSSDPQLQSSHFQLSSEIVGCQKQLLEIELRQTQKQKAQLLIELQQQRSYTVNLQKQVDNLEKLLDGQKKLNEKLDRQLYLLINASKQMKIQLLEERAKTKQLQEEIFQLEQAVSQHNKQTTQLQQKITQLQIQEKKLPRMQEQIQQLKSKLEISEKKYEQLRKIKLQLQEKVEEFQLKFVEIEKKQTEDQVKTSQFHETIKSENQSKIKQIEQMSITIKQKYQQKIQIMEKQYKQLKDKYKALKQQNSRLYDGIDLQSKKQIKLQDKLQKTKSKQSELQDELIELKKDKQILDQKAKTQALLAKQLKKQLLFAEKGKALLQRKLKKLQISVLPNILAEIKILKQQNFNIKTTISTYKQLVNKTHVKALNEYQLKVQNIVLEFDKKVQTLKQQITNLRIQSMHYKKCNQDSLTEKSTLLQRLTFLQTKETSKQVQVHQKEEQILDLQQKLSNLQSVNIRLQKEIQNYRKIQKSGLEQIELLRAKHKEIQKFYDLVDQLTQQNKKLNEKLESLMAKRQQDLIVKKKAEYATFSNQHNNHHSSISRMFKLPQKPQREKKMSKSGQGLYPNHSHSCAHIRPLSKNKSSTGIQLAKSPSLQKRSNNPNQQTNLSYQLPIQSRPIMFNSRQNLTTQVSQKYEAQTQSYMQNEKMRFDFENQKLRLEQIKNQYQKMMADKFRDEFIEKRYLEKPVF